jgi:hypothetical protein
MFQETVSAICYEIGDWHFAGGESPLLAPPYNDVTEVVLEQCKRMPDYLRLPIRIVTVAFGLFALLRSLRPYHRNGLIRRRLQRLAWRSSPLGPFRDLMRFYETLATLALYSRPIRRVGDSDAH